MFTLSFETGNAAFHEDSDAMAEEVSRILRLTATRVEAGSVGANVHDWNGNTIGSWTLQEESK